MRIITGLARGKKLALPSDNSIRPTSDMVKEAIFNTIQFDIEGKSVLDLFGGTGQLGIEALSRGAKSAVIVDDNPSAVKLIKTNLSIAGLPSGTAVRDDAFRYLERDEKFDIIFLDPPFESRLLTKALQKIIEFDKLNDGGIIILEGPADEEPGELASLYKKIKSKKYGKKRITLYTREDG